MPPLLSQLPFLPHHLLLAGRFAGGPTKEDLPHPRDDPQAVAQPLGSLEDEALNGLVLILSLSCLPAGKYEIFSVLREILLSSPGVSADKKTNHG